MERIEGQKGVVVLCNPANWACDHAEKDGIMCRCVATGYCGFQNTVRPGRNL